MQYGQWVAARVEAVAEVDAAADVGGQQEVRRERGDLVQPLRLQAIGESGLLDEITAGGAAAARLFRQREQVELRHAPEQDADRRGCADHVDLGARQVQGRAFRERAKPQCGEAGVVGEEGM